MSELAHQPESRPNGHSHVPLDPQKAARFKRVAPRRVQAALDAIGRVGYLADTRYDYSTDEAEQIVSALRSAVEEVAHKLDRTPPLKTPFAFE